MKAVGILAAAAFALISFSAHGAMIKYTVSDANNSSGNTIGHGLYTFGKNGTGNAKYSIQAGTYFVIDDVANEATLKGTAFNGTYTAIIDLKLSDFAESNAYKQEGGKPYVPGGADDIPGVLAAPGNGDIDFFTTIMGTITINGNPFAIQTCSNCGNSDGLFGFQFGDGANAKNAIDFGGSAWVGVGPGFDAPSHWDLNLTFTQVPEPSSILLMLVGLAALGFMRRKQTA